MKLLLNLHYILSSPGQNLDPGCEVDFSLINDIKFFRPAKEVGIYALLLKFRLLELVEIELPGDTSTSIKLFIELWYFHIIAFPPF